MKKAIFALVVIALVAILVASQATSVKSSPISGEKVFSDKYLSVYSAPKGLSIAQNSQGGVQFYCPCLGFPGGDPIVEMIFDDASMGMYFDAANGVYISINEVAGGVSTSCACPNCEAAAEVSETPMEESVTTTPVVEPTPDPRGTCYKNGNNRWGEETPNGHYQCQGGD